MLKKLAVALVAASVSAAPVLAKTASPAPVAKPAVTATTKIATPVKHVKHVKKSRHTGKHATSAMARLRISTVRAGPRSSRPATS